MKILNRLVVISLIMGCTIGPDYEKPTGEIPEKWHKDKVFEQGDMRLEKWWEIFDDSSLNLLIETARENNKDIKIAMKNIEIAEFSSSISKSLLFPTIDSSGYLKRSKLSISQEPDAMGKPADLYGLELGASWELDIFGKNRRAYQSSKAMVEAAKASYDDVLVTLYAEIATNYVNLRTLEKRLEVSKQSVKSRQSTLEIVKKRYDAQLVAELDIHQAEQNLASSQALIPALESAIERTKNNLTFLSGMTSGMLDDLLIATNTIPEAIEKIKINIPAEALRQRPDIRIAEQNLIAQTAMIGVRKADLLPSFSLNGVFGVGANGNALFSSGNKVWNVGGAFGWNIFDFSRIRNLVKIEELKTENAVNIYENSVLNALRDVEDAIIVYAEENERLKYLEKATTSSKKATEQVKVLYKNGLTDFQNVLSAERDSLTHEDMYIQSQGLKINGLIALYRAFGGGWQNSYKDKNDIK